MSVIYLAGGALGAANGLVAAYLAWGMQSMHKKGLLISVGLGALFGWYIAWLYGVLGRDFWGMLLISGALLSASLTDVSQREISVRAMAVYAVILMCYQIVGMNLFVCINALLGAVAGCLILGVPYLLRPGSIGRGDVLLLTVCGLGTGFPGIIYVLTRGLLPMAVVSMVQLLRKKATVRSELPMAPFLLFGALI